MYVNVSRVPQKVKRYTVMTAPGEASLNLCTVYSLNSVHKFLPLQGARHQVCIQLHCCLAMGTLPQSSGTSSQFVKAVISMYEERRKSKAESNRKPVTEFVCITPFVWTQRAKSPREVGKEAEPFYLSTEGATACRRGWTTEEGINPHSVRIFGSEWQQVRLLDRARGGEWVSLPEYKRKNCLEGYENFAVLKA